MKDRVLMFTGCRVQEASQVGTRRFMPRDEAPATTILMPAIIANTTTIHRAIPMDGMDVHVRGRSEGREVSRGYFVEIMAWGFLSAQGPIAQGISLSVEGNIANSGEGKFSTIKAMESTDLVVYCRKDLPIRGGYWLYQASSSFIFSSHRIIGIEIY